MNDRDLIAEDYFNELHQSIRSFKKSYLPSFNDLADYNTNASSYYDFLNNFIKVLDIMIDYINELMLRVVNVEDTETIDLSKLKDWVNCYSKCKNREKNYETLLKADVIFSTQTVNFNTKRHGVKILQNATSNLKGVFSPNFNEVIEELDTDISENLKKILKNIEDIKNHYNEFNTFKNLTEQNINNINGKITQIENSIRDINNKLNLYGSTIEQLKTWHKENITKITKNINDINSLKSALQKIIENLFSSGAINSNNINDFRFLNNIASGNINIFSKDMDSQFFIKTNKNNNNYDLAFGVNENV